MMTHFVTPFFTKMTSRTAATMANGSSSSRRRPPPSPRHRGRTEPLLAAVAAGIFWYACVWRTQSLLHQTSLNDYDSPIDKSIRRRGEPEDWKRKSKRKRNGAGFIDFRPIAQGQGAGNIVHGLLAVHALAEEFHRIVCTQQYKDFNEAFRPINPKHVEACQNLDYNQDGTEFRLINYEAPVNECMLKKHLASEREIVRIVGNTYPRWRPIPDKYFLKYYAPTPKLKAMLPNPMPKTVVHLRQGDRGLDHRYGLDEKSLEALGKALPSDTYLVTNHLPWYDYFADKYQWRHPDWHAVEHSASRALLWETRGEITQKDKSHKVQNLQLWSDWFVIANADPVWHTHSDFSLSAIHWMNMESRTIKGVDHNGKLKLIDEFWRTDETVIPLKDRGPGVLKHCRKETTKDKFVSTGHVM